MYVCHLLAVEPHCDPGLLFISMTKRKLQFISFSFSTVTLFLILAPSIEFKALPLPIDGIKQKNSTTINFHRQHILKHFQWIRIILPFVILARPGLGV